MSAVEFELITQWSLLCSRIPQIALIVQKNTIVSEVSRSRSLKPGMWKQFLFNNYIYERLSTIKSALKITMLVFWFKYFHTKNMNSMWYRNSILPLIYLCMYIVSIANDVWWDAASMNAFCFIKFHTFWRISFFRNNVHFGFTLIWFNGWKKSTSFPILWLYNGSNYSNSEI